MAENKSEVSPRARWAVRDDSGEELYSGRLMECVTLKALLDDSGELDIHICTDTYELSTVMADVSRAAVALLVRMTAILRDIACISSIPCQSREPMYHALDRAIDLDLVARTLQEVANEYLRSDIPF